MLASKWIHNLLSRAKCCKAYDVSTSDTGKGTSLHWHKKDRETPRKTWIKTGHTSSRSLEGCGVLDMMCFYLFVCLLSSDGPGWSATHD